MFKNIVLASKSKVRKQILDKNNINSEVSASNVDEDAVKKSLLKNGANPEIISKNLAELKANKISQKKPNEIVLGADSVIDLNGEIISKPQNREEAFNILKKLNGKKHYLISSVCISRDGMMIWNYTDKAVLTMKNMKEEDLENYLKQIKLHQNIVVEDLDTNFSYIELYALLYEDLNIPPRVGLVDRKLITDGATNVVFNHLEFTNEISAFEKK